MIKKLKFPQLNSKTQDQPAIALYRVQVRYTPAAPPVLTIEELTIHPGERVALIGASGSGKTTLLRLINGYVQPERGKVVVWGEAVNAGPRLPRRIRRRVGFIFQDFNLIERATVFENVLWGRLGRVHPLLSLAGWFSETDKLAAMRAIAEVDLVTHANKRVDRLSGGQQQRVAIARVLAQEAELILADEPVSNLDPALTHEILALLHQVSQKHGATLILSLHRPTLAQHYADRIVGLREGQVVYDQPSSEFSNTTLSIVYGTDVGPKSKIQNGCALSPSILA